MKTPTQSLLFVALLCACVMQPVLGAPTSCYIDVGAAMPVTMASMSQAIPAGSYSCVSYCFTCTAGDTACTNAQIASSAVLGPTYTYVASTDVPQIAATPGLYNLYSCATNNCNTYRANCNATTGGASPPPPSPPPPLPPPQGATTPSAGSHTALHVAAMLLAALMAVALP